MHRHQAVKSLLTLPTGDSRKRHRVRAGEEEDSDKEEKGRYVRRCELFRQSLCTLTL